MIFMAGFAMLGDIFPADWPGKALERMQMRCCDQTETEERMKHHISYVFRCSMSTTVCPTWCWLGCTLCHCFCVTNTIHFKYSTYSTRCFITINELTTPQQKQEKNTRQVQRTQGMSGGTRLLSTGALQTLTA